MSSKQDKQDRRSQRTRRLVNAAMMDLLREKRYDAITVQDLLDRADIGRSTFYTHYIDKADVLAALIEQIVEMLRQQISQEESEGIFPSLALFRLAYRSHHQPFQAIQRGYAGERLWETMQTSLSKTIEQSLVAACTEKQLSSVPLTVVSEYLAGAFLTLFRWWLSAEMPYTPEQMDKIFQQLALPGVRAILFSKSENARSVL
jgi:AcrR family transcriptional regulator